MTLKELLKKVNEDCIVYVFADKKLCFSETAKFIAKDSSIYMQNAKVISIGKDYNDRMIKVNVKLQGGK